VQAVSLRRNNLEVVGTLQMLDECGGRKQRGSREAREKKRARRHLFPLDSTVLIHGALKPNTKQHYKFAAQSVTGADWMNQTLPSYY